MVINNERMNINSPISSTYESKIMFYPLFIAIFFKKSHIKISNILS